MCGRYASTLPAEALARIFATAPAGREIPSRWNVAPGQEAPVVRRHPASGARRLDLLRWGLVPHWTADPKTGRHPINARAETAPTAPMFRDAFARRRCLVPAAAFYEWQAPPAGATGKPPSKLPPKLPWAIARADGAPLAFAGLWEGWRGPDGAVLRSFVILTTPANAAIAPIHERMPAILEPEAWPLWLGETEGDATGLLRPSAAPLRLWRVSTAVNSPAHDGAALLDAV